MKLITMTSDDDNVSTSIKDRIKAALDAGINNSSKSWQQPVFTNINPRLDSKGNKRWCNDKGELHRDNDLPAVEFINGGRMWYQNGFKVRLTGPAVILADGTKEYWLDGIPYTHDRLLEYLLS